MYVGSRYLGAKMQTVHKISWKQGKFFSQSYNQDQQFYAKEAINPTQFLIINSSSMQTCSGKAMTEFMPFGGPSPDLGERPIDQEKRRKFRPTLVDTGRHKGDSRVAYRGHNIPLHLITKGTKAFYSE